MDADGIAAEVIFAGRQNNEPLPSVGIGWDAGLSDTCPALRSLGEHIWNAWLADFVSVAPHRLLGVFHVPVWDVAAAVREVEWAVAHDLRVMNLPAPRPDFPTYNDDVFEPLWALCPAARDVHVPLTASEQPSYRNAAFRYRDQNSV